MKRILAALLTLTLLLACAAPALAAKLSYEPQTVLMPALSLEIDVPAGCELAPYQDKSSLFWLQMYDEGLRYSGENDDVSISMWRHSIIRSTFEEFAKTTYAEPQLDYEVTATTVNGFPAYRLYRALEPDSEGYLFSNDSEAGATVAYDLFITAKTEAGKALREEILSTLREISVK